MRAVFVRDLRLAVRSGGGFGLGLAFFLIVVIFVPFAIGSEAARLAPVAPGVLWIGALLSALLSLDRIWQLDMDDGSLDLLATSPVPLEGVALAKTAAHWLTTGLPLTLAAPVLGLMLHMPQAAIGPVFLGLLIGTPALSALGTFGAALTVGVRRGGLLLSLLILPFFIPTLIFGSQVAARAVQEVSNSGAMALLGAVTLLSLAISPFAAAAALRFNIK